MVDPSGLQAGREALRTAIEGTKGLAGSIAVYDFSADQHGPTGIKGQAVLRVKGGAFVLEQAA